MKKQLILIVDDIEMNRSMLADMLSDAYETVEASNGREAVELLERRHGDISLVLLDVVMPEMDGFEVLEIMNQKDWISHIPVITISSETGSAYIDQAYDLGATEYISRPFDEKTVQRRVRNTIMLYSKQKALEGMVAEQIVEKERNNYLMVEILSNIVEFRNGESGLHVLHIRTLTEIFLRKLQEITSRYPIPAARMALIVNGSALHDVGKISIPEEILNKPGKLTNEEFAIMKTHSAIGAQIMADALKRNNEELLQVAHNICRWHHERWDGRGYPDGLKGDEIPIEAQVVALADVYDALTSERVYKKAYSHAEALRMILNGECGTFNPVLMECLQTVGPHLEEELKIRSADGISELNLQEISSQVLSAGKASSRTLTLLDQERTKYQFFASMSNEVQFEYSLQADLLSISEWGGRQLGLHNLIEHPSRSAELQSVFSTGDYQDLRERLLKATPDKPIVSTSYCLRVKGEERWYKAIARPLWEGEDQDKISGIIGKFIDSHEEQLRLDHLKKLAEQDSLTMLTNHASARSFIKRTLTLGEGRYALMLLDLDNFKEANDRFGYLFGDQMLQHVAGLLQKGVRGGDIAARVSGDAFLLFFRYEGDCQPIVQRILLSIQGEYRSFQVRASAGVALVPEDGTEYETLFHAADQALHAAKGRGEGICCFYGPAMSELPGVLSPNGEAGDPQ